MLEADSARRRVDRSRLAVASIVSAAVVLASPFIGEIRSAIRAVLPAQFLILVSGTVAAVVVAALVTAMARIRDRRAWRFAVLTAGIAAAALYARIVATGNPEVDVVERVHFIEYGLIAWLFYRAWRRIDNGFALLWPLLGGVFVGIIDELVQWLIPGRIGEAHDVLLDGAAVAIGLCVVASVDPPSRLSAPLSRSATRPLGYAVSAVLVAFAVFFHVVHLGHQLYDPAIGMFRSRFTGAELHAAAADRAHRWKMEPPAGMRHISREDQYLSEGLWHVQARNLAWTAGDPFTAWRENRILETFFAPVLDAPSYASRVPPRWPPEERAAIAARVAEDPGIYISRAAPYPIYTWPPLAFWSAVAVAIAAIITAC